MEEILNSLRTFFTAPSLCVRSFNANIFWVEKHSPLPSSLEPPTSLLLVKQDLNIVLFKNMGK